jgi:hypothetical protein
MEISMEVPQKQLEIPFDPAMSLQGIYLKQSVIIYKRYLHTHVYCCTIHKSQVLESVLVPINRGIYKENMVHIDNGVLLNHKEKQNQVIIGKWMEWEIFM